MQHLQQSKLKVNTAMHDGYIFTIGICGTASDNNPAPALLAALLAALPPVKRAALLGEVVALEDSAHFSDTLLPPIVADIVDAEVVVIVTPLRQGDVPARLRSLLDDATAATVAQQGQRAAMVLVGIGNDTSALDAVRRFCVVAKMTLAVDALVSEAEAGQAATHAELARATQHAYALARRRLPQALPQSKGDEPWQ